MNRSGNTESGGRKLTTADLAAAARQPETAREVEERSELDRDVQARDARAAEREVRGAAAGRDAREDREARDASEGKAREERDPRDGREAQEAARSVAPQTTQRSMPLATTPSAMPTPAPSEKLEPLFAPQIARDYRVRWSAVQSGFVDDPRKAAKQGDELVAQVMKSLAESFAAERDKLEGQLGQTGEASTEILRVSLRRYRSFFERLLSL
jgi:hypothetical protein